MAQLPTYAFIALFVVAALATLIALFALVRGLGDRQPILRLSDEAINDERNAILRALRDLRYEHEVGKIDAELFRSLDAAYRARARELLTSDSFERDADALIAALERSHPAATSLAAKSETSEASETSSPVSEDPST